jgi:hypothetical protein
MEPRRERSTSNDTDEQKMETSAIIQESNDNNNNKIERLLLSLRKEMNERFEILTRENREILSAIEEMKMKIGDVHEVVNPAPIWKLITDHPDIFEKHVLKS